MKKIVLILSWLLSLMVSPITFAAEKNASPPASENSIEDDANLPSSSASETDTEENQNPDDKEINDEDSADDDIYDDQEDASKVDNFDDETENRIHDTSEPDKHKNEI
jgi:hypothetical protein